MKQTRNNNSNRRIISLLMILGLSTLLLSGCQQINNLVNGNTTANQSNTNQANTNTANSNVNATQPSKNSLIGTWIDVDDPTKKITFTDAEFTTTIKNDEVEKGTYKIIGEQEMETTSSAGRIDKGKFTLDGDLLTLSSGDVSKKFKRESAATTAANAKADYSKFKEFKKLEGHSHAVSSVAFSPDGKTLASGSYDKTVRLWNVADGKELKKLEGHSGNVYSVAFSPDGKTLASGSIDKTVKLWRAE